MSAINVATPTQGDAHCVARMAATIFAALTPDAIEDLDVEPSYYAVDMALEIMRATRTQIQRELDAEDDAEDT